MARLEVCHLQVPHVALGPICSASAILRSILSSLESLRMVCLVSLTGFIHAKLLSPMRKGFQMLVETLERCKLAGRILSLWVRRSFKKMRATSGHRI